MSTFSCGDARIDAYRDASRRGPTSAENFWDRVDALWAWMMILQRIEADLAEFVPILDRIEVRNVEEFPADVLQAVDDGFTCLETIHRRTTVPVDLIPADPPARVTPAGGRPGGAAWPVYGADAGHTAGTQEIGPQHGRIAWRFAMGFAWYARPLVQDGRVFVASPGMRTHMHCFDLRSGRTVWSTWRHRTGRATPHSHVLPQCYTLPAAASSVVSVGGRLVVAELGAQAADEGARHLLFVDRQTGELERRVPIGHADYRMGHARLAGDGRWVVHPDGVQRIKATPPQCIGHHRLLCREAATGELAWDFPVGLHFGEPVLDDHRVYVGTQDGAVLSLNLEGASAANHFGFSDTRRVAWQMQAGGSVNGSVAVDAGRAVFGANDGRVYCVDSVSGALVWRCDAERPEPRAFQQFSMARAYDGRVYIGSAGRKVHCIDGQTGRLLWSIEASHWVRSRPIVHAGLLMVGGLDGWVRAYTLRPRGKDDRPEPAWALRLGRFALLADLVLADGVLLMTDAGLRLHAVDAVSGRLLWSRPLLLHADCGGVAVQVDEMGSGGFHQSKPTMADGRVYCGSPSRFVVAVDQQTGAECWRFEMGGAVSGAPAYAAHGQGAEKSGRVLIGQQGGEDAFYCLDARTGEPVWKQALGWVWSSANVADGRVFVPCVDGHFACLDLADGAIRWRYRSARAAHPEAPVADGVVYFGSWDHFVYAFDAQTGRLRWKFHTGGTPDSGAPIAHGRRLYVPMGGRRLCCLHAEDGAVVWEFCPERGCMNASPALAGGRLFVSMSLRTGAVPPVSEIRCLSAEDGRLLWRFPGGGITGPSVCRGAVVFGSTSQCALACVDAAGRGDGSTELLWRVRLGGRVYESVPALGSGLAVILCEDGYLYAVE